MSSTYPLLEETFQTTAVFEKNYFYHFGIIKETAFLYSRVPEEIKIVKFQISEDQSPDCKAKTEPDYWGCWDFKTKSFKFIQPSLGQLRLQTDFWNKLENDYFKFFRLKVIFNV